MQGSHNYHKADDFSIEASIKLCYCKKGTQIHVLTGRLVLHYYGYKELLESYCAQLCGSPTSIILSIEKEITLIQIQKSLRF